MRYNEHKELYDKMKPSAFIIAELSVLMARLESADNSLTEMPIVTPAKYARAIAEIRRQIQVIHLEMVTEQAVHQKRIDELFGVRDDSIPF